MHQGAGDGPFFATGALRFPLIVEAVSRVYIPWMISKAQRIILSDHARLPWRFFGRLTAVQAGL
jgi:hypothetical protein